MSSDAWAQVASRRQRRHWRGWPWGWTALCLSVGAWACMAVMAFLVTASIGMPGDGDHGMQATRVPMTITLGVSAMVALGCIVASVLSLRLGHRPIAGAAALVLLLVLLLLWAMSLLALMA